MHRHPDAMVKWKNNPNISNEYRELFAIDGEPFEFEWNILRRITNLKDSGMLLQMSWSPILKTADIQSAEFPVRWIGIIEKERWGMYDSLKCGTFERRAFASHENLACSFVVRVSPRGFSHVFVRLLTSVRILLMQSFHFARSILQISSVSTEQSRIGVMLTQEIPSQSFSSVEKSIAKATEQFNRKLEPEDVNTLVRAPETNVSSRERERSTTWSPSEIRKIIKRDQGISDLWFSWIHEESLYWTLHPNNSRCEWWL